MTLLVFWCPDESCVECDSYNKEERRGICSKCTKEFKIKDERCVTFCGNGLVEIDEECDDLNNENGDGCSSKCKNESMSLKAD